MPEAYAKIVTEAPLTSTSGVLGITLGAGLNVDANGKLEAKTVAPIIKDGSGQIVVDIGTGIAIIDGKLTATVGDGSNYYISNGVYPIKIKYLAEASRPTLNDGEMIIWKNTSSGATMLLFRKGSDYYTAAFSLYS